MQQVYRNSNEIENIEGNSDTSANLECYLQISYTKYIVEFNSKVFNHQPQHAVIFPHTIGGTLCPQNKWKLQPLTCMKYGTSRSITLLDIIGQMMNAASYTVVVLEWLWGIFKVWRFSPGTHLGRECWRPTLKMNHYLRHYTCPKYKQKPLRPFPRRQQNQKTMRSREVCWHILHI